MPDNQGIVIQSILLERLDHGHASFATLLSGLTDEQMVEPGVVGGWSVKDVLAHLIAHEQQALEELRYALRGESLRIDHDAIDRFNAAATAARSEQSLAEVRAAWEASYQQVVEQVAALSEEDFDPSGPVAEALGDSIDGALANNTYEHYREHMAQIESVTGHPFRS